MRKFKAVIWSLSCSFAGNLHGMFCFTIESQYSLVCSFSLSRPIFCLLGLSKVALPRRKALRQILVHCILTACILYYM